MAFGFLKKKNKFVQTYGSTKTNKNILTSQCVYFNPMVDVCAEACACCWDKPIPKTYKEKLKYLSNRAKTGHMSIFEHSNFVIYLELSEKYIIDLLEVFDTIRYLETATRYSDKTNTFHVLIGGTLSGYYHLLNNIHNLDNIVLSRIKEELYCFAPSSAFETLIEDGIMDRDMFSDVEEEGNIRNIAGENNLIEIINLDSIKTFLDNLKDACDDPNVFDIMDISRMLSCTVLFKGMSRIITQQLTRHRNGITQESQRYVDYSEAMFNSPAQFKPDKYDENHVYHINFGGVDFHMTLKEIGLAEQGIYKYLRDPEFAGEEHHLLKEDARGYLPGNIKCGKVYMTFTLKNLFKFLQLREDDHAQAEIREYAKELGKLVRSILSDYDLDECIKPYYSMKDKIAETNLVNVESEESTVEDDWVDVVMKQIESESDE